MTLPYSQRPLSAQFLAFQRKQEKRRQRMEADWEKHHRLHKQASEQARNTAERMQEAYAKKHKKAVEIANKIAVYVMRDTAHQARVERNRIFRQLVATLRGRTKYVAKKRLLHKQEHAFFLLGCSLEKFKHHLERKFHEDMTWENYGAVWLVGHIKPTCSFNLRLLKEQRRFFSYRNLQPVFIKEDT